MAGIEAIPEQIQDVGRKANGLAQEVGSIVSAGAAYLEMAGSGNVGFLTTPAMAALTVAQIAALKNLGGLLDEHGRDLSGASKVYATTEQAVVRSATPTASTATTATATPGQTASRSLAEEHEAEAETVESQTAGAGRRD